MTGTLSHAVLSVLNVAYPFAPVGFDAVGGAEQVLAQLDHALVQAGHNSIVVAREGSTVEGTLIPTPKAQGEIDRAMRERVWAAHQRNLEQALKEHRVDIVHFHGIDFDKYLPTSTIPALVTLHLPPEWYPKEIFERCRPNMVLHCVSRTQTDVCPACPHLLPPIENGVAEAFFNTGTQAGDYTLCLGRICQEKGFHIAMDAADRIGTKLLLAGEVFPYPIHQEYFRSQILPRLNATREFIGPVGFEQKLHLLANARCLLAPSLVHETSSLVAMEAMASGCPVVAFPSGALGNLVEHGTTGFLVSDLKQMAEAIENCQSFSREQIRARARHRFSLSRTMEAYLATYRSLTEEQPNMPGVPIVAPPPRPILRTSLREAPSLRRGGDPALSVS
jgi:glycosyltransferase involved in cell wall biosynthesis